ASRNILLRQQKLDPGSLQGGDDIPKRPRMGADLAQLKIGNGLAGNLCSRRKVLLGPAQQSARAPAKFRSYFHYVCLSISLNIFNFTPAAQIQSREQALSGLQYR